MTSPLLETQALDVVAGPRTLIGRLDWQVRRGERWAVLGPNGCGKSSLLRVLAGLNPARGLVLLDGEPLQNLSVQRLSRLRAYAAQEHHDVFAMTALDVVLAARRPYAGPFGWLGPQDRTFALHCLARCDAAHLVDQDVRHLSGGERQRVALAAALAQDTPLLLLDEPTAHLDVPHQQGVCELLLGLADRAVVLSLHDVNLALACCSHALVCTDRLAPRWLAGPVEEVLSPATLEAAYGWAMVPVPLGGRLHYLPATTPRGAR
ncbi:MAG TPA: ABC transporter ATP-binding protein [Burkholderiaceae bacterium]|nr:ABC transporter ATP-binding protein [Burkholderiaceae bacterium]